MRITRDDSDHLVTVDFAWLTALGCATVGPFTAIRMAMDQRVPWHVCIAPAIFIISLLGANQFATRVVFDFDKRRRELTWTSTSLTRRRRMVISFSDIHSVRVQWELRNANPMLYRIELHAANRVLPLSGSFSAGSKDELDSIAERINFVVRER
jgi:hypothetical protein